eukprot:767618-Hanusia_phi.AAC.3
MMRGGGGGGEEGYGAEEEDSLQAGGAKSKRDKRTEKHLVSPPFLPLLLLHHLQDTRVRLRPIGSVEAKQSLVLVPVSDHELRKRRHEEEENKMRMKARTRKRGVRCVCRREATSRWGESKQTQERVRRSGEGEEWVGSKLEEEA